MDEQDAEGRLERLLRLPSCATFSNSAISQAMLKDYLEGAARLPAAPRAAV